MTAPAGRKNGRYASKVGGKHTAPSVTAVLGVLNKPGLPWGAAKETALFAIHHQDQWIDLPEQDAYERLRKHHKGVWNDKANTGSLVHDLALGWAQGREVDCPPHCGPYLDALEQFYLDWQPEWVCVERSIVCQRPGLEYGGTFDAIGRVHRAGHDLDGKMLEIDLKTGRRYPIETALQLTAYRYADALAIYDNVGELVDTEPIPAVDATAVLYLHDDGTYELLEVPSDEEVFETFLALRRAWGWLQQMQRWEKAHPPLELATA